MSSGLKGVCIGGPLDGEERTILYGRDFKAPIPRGVPNTPISDDVSSFASTVIGDMCIYRHVYMHHVDDRGTAKAGFWVPIEEWGGDDAKARYYVLNALVARYAEPEKDTMRRLMRRNR